MFISEKDKHTYIKMYNNTYTIAEIAKIYNQKWSIIYQAIKNDIEDIKEEQEICKLYMEGNSVTKIGLQYNINHHLVSKILEKYGIARTGLCRRKYQLNETYFDLIDTSTKAYILGLLYADGSNCLSK